jgi:Sel1 repeat
MLESSSNHREAGTDPKDVVVLLHGIRTRALWYDTAKNLLSRINSVEVRTIGYGRFDLVKFLLPFTRKSARRLVLKELRAIKWHYQKQSFPFRISVIAHSFGTYTIVKILEEEDDLDLDTLVLCGSVLPSNYDFGAISRKVSGSIINDAGSRDIFPVLARLVTVGYGDSGTFGFLKGLCRDRFFNFKHSDFFATDFISKYWVTIFSERRIEDPGSDRSLWKSPLTIRLLSMFPEALVPKFILPAVAVFLLLPTAVDSIKSKLMPLLSSETLIQADRERVCKQSVGQTSSEGLTAALVSPSTNTSFKAEILCELAREGNPNDAQLLSLYARALVSSGKVERAVSLFSEAAEKGDTMSLEVLANYYSHYIEPNEEKCVQYYQKLLGLGDADAALALGVLFETGVFGKYDYSIAADYYKKAVNQNNTSAMYRLGQLYEFGLGLETNLGSARDLYRKAAARGNADAVEALNQLNKRKPS